MQTMKTETHNRLPTRSAPAPRPGRPAGRIAGTVLALTLGLSTLAVAQPKGRCANVVTPWPVVLPDGSAHESDSLQLCLMLKLNPVTGIHELRVDGMSRGMVRSRIGVSEGRTADDPIVVFRRTESDVHVLVGYAWPDGDTMRTFNLYDLSGKRAAAARTEELALDDPPRQEEFVLLVARRPN